MQKNVHVYFQDLSGCGDSHQPVSDIVNTEGRNVVLLFMNYLQSSIFFLSTIVIDTLLTDLAGCLPFISIQDDSVHGSWSFAFTKDVSYEQTLNRLLVD